MKSELETQIDQWKDYCENIILKYRKSSTWFGTTEVKCKRLDRKRSPWSENKDKRSRAIREIEVVVKRQKENWTGHKASRKDNRWSISLKDGVPFGTF